MAPPTQPLRDEHRELLPYIERLRAVADSVGAVSPAALTQGIDEVYDFLTHHLIPHAQAEDHAPYPAMQRALGAPGATATMSRDHIEVGRLTAELAALRAHLTGTGPVPAQLADLRRVLYGLYALIRVHFAKEEEIYLPLLDQMWSDQDARTVFEAMGHVAHHARADHAA